MATKIEWVLLICGLGFIGLIVATVTLTAGGPDTPAARCDRKGGTIINARGGFYCIRKEVLISIE